MNKQQTTKAKKLRAKGLSYTKIGEAIGVSHTTIQNWLNPEYADKNRKRCREQNRERNRKRRNNIETRVQDCLTNSKKHAAKHGYKACLTEPQIIIDAFTGKCHSCGIAESDCKRCLAMDHCHYSGEFRAWLCERCNHVEGHIAERGHLVNKILSDWFIANGPETQKALAKFGKRRVTIRRNHPKKSNVRP